MLRTPLITAHRGSSAIAPENTLAALQQAILDGADLAEVDVQATADGELVLCHDASLQRTAGDPRQIWQTDYAALAALDVGCWFDSRFTGERLPRLQEAIALVTRSPQPATAVAAKVQRPFRLNLELKSYGPQPDFARCVIEQILAHDFAQRCIVTSFDHGLLRQVRQQAPSLTVGLICDTPPADLNEFDLYSVHLHLATPELIHRIHALHKAVHVWTVNEPTQMRQLARQGVDSLITDNPRLLRQVLEEGQSVESRG